MAVADWLIHLKDKLEDGAAAVSIITSGDIDAVPIHLHAVSRFWTRDINNKFTKDVFVVLQKPFGRQDIYNITGMLTVFENKYCDGNIGSKIAMGLCIGGNDFIPKLFQVSHEKILNLIINSPYFRQELFTLDKNRLIINKLVFVDLMRTLYCPRKYQNQTLSYQQVRAVTIGKTEDKDGKGGYRTNDPRKWLPPESAILRVAELVQLQVLYLETAGTHDAICPDFLKSSCLHKNCSNEVVYDFGPDSHFTTIEDLPTLERPDRIQKKRQLDSTPQKGLRRKRPLTSTPKPTQH